jgi:KDEL-tailed cysteine endopeptidase
MTSVHGFPKAIALVVVSLSASSLTAQPASFDWRVHGAVTNVSNMGQQCGADYAFVAAEALESVTAIRTGQLKTLSAQESVDCSTVAGNVGCRGGSVEGAFRWIISNGLATVSAYPYTGRDGSCKQHQTPAARMSSYRVIPTDIETLMQAVTQQPVAALIDVGSDYTTYRRGVYPCRAGGPQKFWVLIVGYGADGGQPYWLMKNSMGTAWGENGYIRILRSKGCPNIDKAVIPVL